MVGEFSFSMPSSSPKAAVVFLLLSLIAVVASFDVFDPRRHSFPPWFDRYEEDTEDFRQTLTKPWIAVDEQQLLLTLANTTGFRIASAILQKHYFASSHPVDMIYTGPNPWDKSFIPNCDGITIYITYLENEMEILQNDPGIVDEIRSIDEIRSGQRRSGRSVLKEFVKKVMSFDAGGNVSVSRPFIYSDEEGVVVVHGVDYKGYEATEIQIKKLSLSSPQEYVHDFAFRPMVVVYGADGFEDFEFPLSKNEEEFISKSKMKIQMAIVASIVPTPQEIYYGRHFMPHKVTMLYNLHF